MSLFKLDDNSDLDRGPDGKGFTRVQDDEETRVHCRTRLRLFRGEVKRNKFIGVNYFGLVRDPRTPPDTIAAHLADIILQTPGIVDNLLRYEVDFDAGVMQVEFDATYESEDQRIRRPIHESLPVLLGEGPDNG